VQFQIAVALADVAVDHLDGLAGIDLLGVGGEVVPQRHPDAAGLVADDEVGDPTLVAVVALEGPDGLGVEDAPPDGDV
jgi:hypothetical protein